MTEEESNFALKAETWMNIAKQYYSEGWTPSIADFHKSALLERLLNGKAPLKYPPPVSYSCPHYALVEDAGPHYAGSNDSHYKAVLFHDGTNMFVGVDDVVLFQHRYEIVHSHGKIHFIRDVGKKTPYMFVLWYDPEWQLPTNNENKDPPGGWFMQNIIFSTDPYVMETSFYKEASPVEYM
jgi:hypothetical protein